MKGKRELLRKISIASRLRVVFLPILMGSIVLITVVAGHLTRQIIIDKVSQGVIHNLELIAVNIQTLSEEAESCANTVIINVNNSIGFRSIDPFDLQDVQDTLNVLKTSKVIFGRVDEISFVDHQGGYITEILSKDFPVAGRLGDHVFMEKIRIFEEEGGWLSPRERNPLSADTDGASLTYVKKIRNIHTSEDLGYIVLNIFEENLYNIYKEVNPLKENLYKIMDATGYVISSGIREETGSVLDWDIGESQEASVYRPLTAGNRMLVHSMGIAGTDWTVMSFIPLKELTKDVNRMTSTLILIGCAVFILSLIITMKLSQTITSPLTELTDHIKTLKDGTLSKFHVADRMDEIGILNDSFNSLIDRNKDLMRKIDRNERKKREYELALLQDQVKPHFLYNTLDIIYRLASLGKTGKVIKATKNIADFYRLALSKGDDIIPIGKELELVRKYLYIQKIRYPDILDFRIGKMDALEDFCIPKFTIQPLVENAIYHGLKAHRRKGIIEITGSKSGNDILIDVSDTGVGMSREQIDAVLSPPPEGQWKESFGLVNIDERMKLYYGQEYGITLTSEASVGTTVSIRISTDRKGTAHV